MGLVVLQANQGTGLPGAEPDGFLAAGSALARCTCRFFIWKKTEDIQRTTLCIEPVDSNSTMMICADSNGIPVMREAVFGGMLAEGD